MVPLSAVHRARCAQGDLHQERWAYGLLSLSPHNSWPRAVQRLQIQMRLPDPSADSPASDAPCLREGEGGRTPGREVLCWAPEPWA